MEEEEDLDKETVGRKVSTSNIGPIYITQNFYIINITLIYISAIFNEMPKLLVLIQNSSPMKSQIPNNHTYSHCGAKTSIFDDLAQVAEKLPAEILKEYREIFSFFDRFSFTWPRLCSSVNMRSLIICSSTARRALKKCFQSETAVAPSEQRSSHRWSFCLLDSSRDC